MTERVFQNGDQLALPMPEAVSARYHLAQNVEVEVIETEDGILLRPIDVPPWFSVEWERALDTVVEWYGGALKMMGEASADE
jgi:hypothetical protein